MPQPSDADGRTRMKLMKDLLRQRNRSPERVAEIDRQLTTLFDRKAAVLALDMCGFTRMSLKNGILFYLALIVQMEEAATPAVLGNDGQVVKQEADNLFAVFNHPADALEAALDIFRAFEAVNSVVPDVRDLHGCIGIGYGETLVLDGEDMFGNEMNLACKLGEDIARAGEILLTAAAHDAMPAGKYVFEPRTFEISRMQVPGYQFVKRMPAGGEVVGEIRVPKSGSPNP